MKGLGKGKRYKPKSGYIRYNGRFHKRDVEKLDDIRKAVGIYATTELLRFIIIHAHDDYVKTIKIKK